MAPPRLYQNRLHVKRGVDNVRIVVKNAQDYSLSTILRRFRTASLLNRTMGVAIFRSDDAASVPMLGLVEIILL